MQLAPDVVVVGVIIQSHENGAKFMGSNPTSPTILTVYNLYGIMTPH